ncbi:C6 zinc finger domain-containing protein [Hyaloscypha sp. PMI_1271]|nr:C6 zinc finger domain-containing protein [Hyaloscypha sp. PMI_1271]
MDDLDAHRAYGPHNHLSGGDAQASPVTRDDAPTANKTRGYKGPRKQEGIKRACNECRQQKLRCDVVREPFSSCSRCQRLGLSCRIEASFQRVEKRKSKQELQRVESRPLQTHRSPSHASQPSLPLFADILDPRPIPETRAFSDPATPAPPTRPEDLPLSENSSSIPPTHPTLAEISGLQSPCTNEVRSLNWSVPSAAVSATPVTRTLDAIELSVNEIQGLFNRYFQHYHKFLPFLNPLKPPDYYYRCSHLLFWAIIAVASRRYNEDLSLLTSLSRSVPRLLWSVLQPVPHSYHDVKALCLLCTWPFPLSSSSRDPTLMLSGTMINLCLHFGLHRPNHAQDFSKFKVALPFEDLQDRMATWNACKIVAQSVATGYGQPSFVPLDDVLISQAHNVHAQQMSQELRDRLQIESFCQRIAKTLDCMSHSCEAVPNDEVVTTMQALKEDLSQLQKGMDKSETGGVLAVYLCCTQLHLRLYTLFSNTNSHDYIESLLSLFEACRELISLVRGREEDILIHCPNYIFQMILASGFAVLRLSTSPMSEYIDSASSRTTFNSAIFAIRKISVSNNDLPGRLADVLAQLKARGNRVKRDWQNLQPNVRSRMSMSITFDSLWEWRKGFESSGSKPTSGAQYFLFPFYKFDVMLTECRTRAFCLNRHHP